jgi:hypothetical protein
MQRLQIELTPHEARILLNWINALEQLQREKASLSQEEEMVLFYQERAEICRQIMASQQIVANLFEGTTHTLPLSYPAAVTLLQWLKAISATQLRASTQTHSADRVEEHLFKANIALAIEQKLERAAAPASRAVH